MRKARFSFNRGGILNRLRRAAIIAFWLHLLAGASMALVLRRGLETNPNFQDRLAFIVNQRALWISGWLTWTAAAIAILYFYMTFSAVHRLARHVALLAPAGVGPEPFGQAIVSGGLARR